MNDPTDVPGLLFLIGATIVLSMLIKAALHRLGVPPLIGFIGLGLLLGLADTQWYPLPHNARHIYEFLALLGIVSLLFRVGLESKVSRLVGQLRRARTIWLGDVVCSGLFGYLAAALALGLDVIPSLVVAIALSATSLGVSVGLWQEAGIAQSTTGQLLIDVAELDDLSGVILMALVFALIPVFGGEAPDSLGTRVAGTLLTLLGALSGFAAFCFLFSRFVEHPLTTFFRRIVPTPNPMLLVTGTGIMIAALAGLLGFSVAIGAFFAGLVFSRDPQAVKMDASFSSLYELFSPFFFVGIGLHLDLSTLASGVGAAVVLLLPAVLGKVIGAGGAALLFMAWKPAVLLGLSMIPRAEIAMVILLQGRLLGTAVVPPDLFAAMVIVSGLTCVGAPLSLAPLLRRWRGTLRGAQ